MLFHNVGLQNWHEVKSQIVENLNLKTDQSELV